MVIVADQITKFVILRSLPFGASRPVLGPLLSLTHTRNTGGAFSLFQANNEIFIVVASLATVALLVAYHRYHRDHLPVAAALALALGGAIGNLIDRIRYGYVVDFFDIHIWPIFNIADSAITVAIVVLLWRFLLAKEPGPATEPNRGRSAASGSAPPSGGDA